MTDFLLAAYNMGGSISLLALSVGDRAGSNRSLVDAKETFQTLFEISCLLNTGLDMETLAICVRLCENGATPEALAIIKPVYKQVDGFYRLLWTADSRSVSNVPLTV